MKNFHKTDRYQRQELLKEFGEDGQQKLLNAKVLVIGAGGLGCAALQYLAAAGAGNIGIVDFDVVELSNLQRQVLYGIEDIGKKKAVVAGQKLFSLNSEIIIKTFDIKISNQNAIELISDYDLVIDGTDNFTTRYVVNDACVLLNRPLVYGAVLRFEGQVGVFNLPDKVTGVKTNYRDIFPEPPPADTTQSCNEAGVLGVAPGIIGILQATEAIKIITGIGTILCNQILSYNILTNTQYVFSVSPGYTNNSIIPKTISIFKDFDYEWFCGNKKSEIEISVEIFEGIMGQQKIRIIDVREFNELPEVSGLQCEKIPLSGLINLMDKFDVDSELIFICQTGKRSLKAAETFNRKRGNNKAYSLSGGITEWHKYKHH